jgi:hypothetical protein
MVAFARICFADPPELTGPGGPFEEEEKEGKVWEAELERAGGENRSSERLERVLADVVNKH